MESAPFLSFFHLKSSYEKPDHSLLMKARGIPVITIMILYHTRTEKSEVGVVGVVV